MISKTALFYTTGIIIQKVVPEMLPLPEYPARECQVPIKKNQRSVVAPTATIAPYGIGVKKTPRFDGSALDESMMKLLVSNNSRVNAYKLDMAYCMIKHVTADEEDHWPGWTGFNTLLRKDNIPGVSRIGYLPIVDASPTEYSTLNEVLKSGIRIIEKLHLQQTVLVFDEAVYAKIQHIRWKEQLFYDRFVVRLGEFHASMSYLSAISKLFEDGGLKVIVKISLLGYYYLQERDLIIIVNKKGILPLEMRFSVTV